MSCPVDCKNRPDAVDKLDWKCKSCGRNLKEDFDAVMAKRKEESEKAPLLARKAELESQIAKIQAILVDDTAEGRAAV